MYNQVKFRIFIHIEKLRLHKITPLARNIAYVMNRPVYPTCDNLYRLKRWGFVRAKDVGCGQNAYYLTKKGRSSYRRLHERYQAGQDLKLKRTPQPYDWSGISFKVDTIRLQELKDDAERARKERRREQNRNYKKAKRQKCADPGNSRANGSGNEYVSEQSRSSAVCSELPACIPDYSDCDEVS